MDTKKIYTIDDLKVWDFRGTALAVIGKPIEHSLSPIMHNAAIKQLSHSDSKYNEWAYFRFEIDPSDLPEALELFYNKRFLGLNLTVPHKVMTLDLLEVISESAMAIGAVNTLKWTTSGYEGFNTDGYGLSKGIEQGLGKSLNGSNVLILGAGGAARAAVVECLSQNAAAVHVLNRSKARLDDMFLSLSKLKGFEYVFPIQAKEDLANFPEISICINATSLGLNENDPTPVDVKFLNSECAVYDMIYNQPVTKLCFEAKKLGCPVKTGLGMLVYQGAKALEIWTQQKIDAKIMKNACEKVLYYNANG